MTASDNRPDHLEIILVVFLVIVIIVALLTILGPQIESFVYSMTGR